MARRISLLLALMLAVASGAAARAPVRRVYSTIVTYPSAAVILSTGAHGHGAAFTWTCDAIHPPDPMFSTIALSVGRLVLRHGRLRYRGRATVTGSFGQPRYGHTTITIVLRRLRPHLYRYVYAGRPETARFAFAGTVSSRYCYSAPSRGAFTLFGPIRNR